MDDEETFVAPADFNPNEYAWSKCAAEGERCACGSDTALVRFGSTGEEMYYAMNSSWFRAHPEVRRFDYKYLRDGAVACAPEMARGGGSVPGAREGVSHARPTAPRTTSPRRIRTPRTPPRRPFPPARRLGRASTQSRAPEAAAIAD